MSELIDFATRVVPGLIGGGLVPLAIFLLRRKSEIKVLDATAATTTATTEGISVSSAAASVNLANLMRDQAEHRVGELEEEMEIRATQARLLAQDTARLRSRLARAEADLVVLRAVHERIVEGDEPAGKAT